MHALLLSLALTLGASDKPTLAVLYFDNNTKNADLDVMRKGLADMIVTDLVAWDGVTVVERDKFEAVVAELKLQRTKYFDQSTAVKIGKFLEARYLLTGSMMISGEKLILDAKLVDATKNAVVVTARADGGKDEVFEIEQALVERVAAGIDVKVKNERDRRRAKVPSLEALVDYSKAIDLSDSGKLDEAQKAFAALVSKSPTFLMARERKEQAVKALEAYNRKKRELISESALRVAKAADEALKAEGRFEALSPSEQATLLVLRRVKGRFLGRLLKQAVSSHESSLRVVLPSKQKQAMEAMRAWLANQQRYLDELAVHGRASAPGRTEASIAPDVLNDITDSGLGPATLAGADQAFAELVRFVFQGHVVSGQDEKGRDADFTVAPTWADLTPDDAKALWKAIDERIEKAMKAAAGAPPEKRDQTARVAAGLLEDKAELLASLRRDDDAVAAFQLILDTYPTDSRNGWRETAIKKLIGGAHDYERDVRERFAKGLRTCEDMDLRVGAGRVADDRVRHQGIDALERFWAELIKACPPSAKTRNVLAYVAKDLAMDAARYEDCERSKRFWRRYIENDGSISDMLGYHRNHTPWCEYGDVTADVLWMKFRLDRHHTPEVNQHLVSVRSHDGKQLSISGRNERGSIDLALYLTPAGGGWSCRDATWRTRDGDQVTGTCVVKLTKEAKDRGDFDEGTFSATFTFQQDGHGMKTELSDGEFRVRRQ